MKDRIRKIRRDLDLTQKAFADRLGMKQNTIATYEMGRSMPSDQCIRSICREFNVNEEWLRNGTGDMFIEAPEDELDAMARRYNLDGPLLALIRRIVNASDADRAVLIRLLTGIPGSFAVGADPAADLDIEAEVESYRRELIEQKKAEAESSASDGSGGTAGEVS